MFYVSEPISFLIGKREQGQPTEVEVVPNRTPFFFLGISPSSGENLLAARKVWLWTDGSEPTAIRLDFKKGCTKDVLLAASQSTHISDYAKSSLDYLLNHFDSLSNDQICTDTSIKYFYHRLRLSTPDRKLTFYVEDCLETARVFAADKPSQQLYWHKQEPLDDIRADNIVQGDAGDCTFKSVLCGLANSRPEQIAAMIQPLDSDTFSVTFPKQNPIVVKAPSWAEQTLYDPECHSGIWQNLVEKAYGLLGASGDNSKEFADSPIEEKTAILWHPQTAIRTLTGHESDFVFFAKVNDANTMKILRQAFANPIKPIVLAGTQQPRDERLDADHTYLVEKLTGAPGSKEEKVVLRNTHGFKTDARGSLLSLSPSQFWENFNDVTIERMK